MKTVLLFLSALLLLACAGKPPEPIKQYPMRGVVTQLDPQNQVETIKHEDIPGFMHAMTMEYGLRDKNEFAKLHNGDTIAATVFVQGDDYWVGDVKPAAPKPAEEVKPAEPKSGK